MTYRFIDDHKDLWPVRLLCETLEVSAAGYYAWRQRPRSTQEQWHDILLVEIRAIHTEVKGRYGSPRMHKELVARGHNVEAQRVYPVHYRDQFIGKLVPDLIVDGQVIADPKVVTAFNETHGWLRAVERQPKRSDHGLPG